MAISGVKRAALVGTAGSWVKTPFKDPSITIVSLNDAYSLRDEHGRGMERVDEWYDIHPFPDMWFRPKDKVEFKEGEIPLLADGRMPYVRPHGHLEWLAERAKSMPVYVQAPLAGTHMQRFPIEDVKKFLHARPDQEAYSSSSPAPILAWLYLRGFMEIHIYGIHLATHQEWAFQRPNFEWLIGRLEERGVNIVLPPECPLLKHSHVYAYEHAPVRPDMAALTRKREIQGRMNAVYQRLITWPRWKSKAEPLAELANLQAELKDAQMQGRHALITAGRV